MACKYHWEGREGRRKEGKVSRVREGLEVARTEEGKEGGDGEGGRGGGGRKVQGNNRDWEVKFDRRGNEDCTSSSCCWCSPFSDPLHYFSVFHPISSVPPPYSFFHYLSSVVLNLPLFSPSSSSSSTLPLFFSNSLGYSISSFLFHSYFRSPFMLFSPPRPPFPLPGTPLCLSHLAPYD